VRRNEGYAAVVCKKYAMLVHGTLSGPDGIL